MPRKGRSVRGQPCSPGKPEDSMELRGELGWEACPHSRSGLTLLQGRNGDMRGRSPGASSSDRDGKTWQESMPGGGARCRSTAGALDTVTREVGRPARARVQRGAPRGHRGAASPPDGEKYRDRPQGWRIRRLKAAIPTQCLNPLPRFQTELVLRTQKP